MQQSVSIENPTSFKQIDTCQRFFILGSCDNARRLHLLLAGKFETRFFGFFKNTPGNEIDPVNMFHVRHLSETLEELDAGDFIFLFDRDVKSEQLLLDKGVRLGFPFNLLTTFSTYEAPIFNAFLAHHFDLNTASGVALDIGANFGLTACTMSPYFKAVHAFEPNAKIFANLKGNPTLCDNIQLYQLAFGAEKGMCKFYDLDGANGSVIESDPAAESYPVPMTTVDAFCAENNIQPQFIKIDAEGLDGEIILSSRDTIEKHKPIIFFENPAAGRHDKDKWEEQVAFLSSHYDLFAFPSLNQLVKYEDIGADFFKFRETHTHETLNIAALPR